MTFKEWLLNEQPGVLFHLPTPISVWINGKAQNFTVDIIDIRAEDWNIQINPNQFEPKNKFPTGPFSAPLADGRFINKEFSAEIGTQALFPIIRKDWAQFAEFMCRDKVVKEALYKRKFDSKVV